MRKTVPFLVIAALTLGCRHGRLYNAEHMMNPCPAGGHSMDPPIVCVTGTDMVSQNPMMLSVHDNAGRTIGHFFANDGTSSLTVTCDDVYAVTYKGNGSPHVLVLPLKRGHFHYTVVMGLKKADPEMQIDP
jgi:hypothetical protein